ncbi:MAG: hypothetical protein DRH24_00515 [Deltaproteobacteria bacterium]|nr:MAG: hypothetical protein DRH24_00515 [Deltaproteobacteria bacterium]
MKIRSPRKKCWFCHIIAKYNVPDLWECKSVRFSLQQIYKIMHNDEDIIFEPRTSEHLTP